MSWASKDRNVLLQWNDPWSNLDIFRTLTLYKQARPLQTRNYVQVIKIGLRRSRGKCFVKTHFFRAHFWASETPFQTPKFDHANAPNNPAMELVNADCLCKTQYSEQNWLYIGLLLCSGHLYLLFNYKSLKKDYLNKWNAKRLNLIVGKLWFPLNWYSLYYWVISLLSVPCHLPVYDSLDCLRIVDIYMGKTSGFVARKGTSMYYPEH